MFFVSQSIELNSNLTIFSDVASKVYKDTDTELFSTIRPDFIVSDGDVELLIIEVKPFNADKSLVEADEIRAAELAKKVLHRRMVKAKNDNEFSTFSMTIVGMYSFNQSLNSTF